MSGLLRLALAVAAGLSAVIAWEVRDAAGPEIADAPGLESQHAAPPLQRVDGNEPSEAWASTVLDRPLFRKDRRPEPKMGEQGARSDARPRLTGIMVGAFGKRAIFKSGENPKSIVVQEGAQVGDFVVRRIEPGRATVESNGNLQTLMPSFAEARGAQRP